MNAKPWYQSKTIVVNSLVILAAVVAAVLGVLQAAPLWDGAAWGTAGLAALNVILRVTTSQAITFNGPTTVQGAVVGGNVGTASESPVARDLTLEEIRRENAGQDGGT